MHSDYPAAAKNNAQKALGWKEKYPKEVTAMPVPKGKTQSTGWKRAKQLAAGKPLSDQDIKVMTAWFARHKNNIDLDPKYKDTPWKDNGYVAGLGWGGREIMSWLNKKRKIIKESFFMKNLSSKLKKKQQVNESNLDEKDLYVVMVLTTFDQDFEEMGRGYDDPEWMPFPHRNDDDELSVVVNKRTADYIINERIPELDSFGDTPYASQVKLFKLIPA